MSHYSPINGPARIISSMANTYNLTYITLIALVLSFIFWLLTIATNSISRFPASAFYYIQQLPAYYWAGMILIIFAIITTLIAKSRLKLKIPCLIELLIIFELALFLFGTAPAIYENPRFHDTYAIINFINILNTDGVVTITGELGYLHSMPGAIIFFSAMSQLADITSMEIAHYYTILLMLILSMAIYCIARKVNKTYAFIAPVGLLSYAWGQEYHMAPQSFSLILYVIFWLIFIVQVVNRKNVYLYNCLLLLLSLSMIISHPLTPLFLLLNIASIMLLDRFLPKNKFLTKGDLILLLYLPAIVYVIWMIYYSNGYVVHGMAVFNSMLYTSMQSVSNTGSIIINYSLSNPQPDQLTLDTIRKVLTIVEVAVGVIGSVYALVSKSSKPYIIFSIWLFSCLIFHGLSMLTGVVYGRVLVFILFPFSILITFALGTKKRLDHSILSFLIIALVIVSALLIPLTYYGGDYFEFVPDTWIAVNHFSSENHISLNKYVLDHINKIDTYDYILYSSIIYNYYQVKRMEGSAYRDIFNGYYNLIYDSTDQKIYEKAAP